MLVELAMLPSEALALEGDCFVVVDVLRASTTIAVMFERGLADLVAVDSLERARAVAHEEGRLLFGEVGGLPPDGFDHGNSPLEANSLELAGRSAVLFTTNGTRALCQLGGRGPVAVGALANLKAVAGWMANFERPVVVCAGTEHGTRFSLDDFAAAGAIIRRALQLSPQGEPGDAAGLALGAHGYDDWLAGGLPQETAKSGRLITGSRHGRYLASIGLGADIAFALREDTSGAVPMVVECGRGWARLSDGRAAR